MTKRNEKVVVSEGILSYDTTQSRITRAVREATLNYGKQLSLHVPHMLRVNMTRDLAHLQLSDLQREIRPYAERLIYRKKESLYAERNVISKRYRNIGS